MKTRKSKTHPRPGEDGEHPWGDAGQAVLLGVFLFAWILDSFVFRLTTFPGRFLPLWTRLGAAGALFFLSVALAGNGHRVLSAEVRRRGELLRDGTFARVRHPLYLGALLFYIALIAATASILSLVLWLIIFGFYNKIASFEEDLLAEKHGREYEIYRNQVPRWLPRLRPAVFDKRLI